MKFPKLKHSILCQLILYFPMSSILWWALFVNVFKCPTWLIIVGVLALGAFSLWYLFRNLMMFTFSDYLFSAIRSLHRDRFVYRTFRNGRSRETVEKRILRRCRLWGRVYTPETASSARFWLFYRHTASWTVFYSIIEKRVAVCSVEHLTADIFREIMLQAGNLLRQIPAGKLRFKTKAEMKARRAYAQAFVILADLVDDDVLPLAREIQVKDQKDKAECLFPCVVECPTGSYLMNGAREYFEPGIMSRPVRNYASALLQRLVFGGFLPKEDRSTRPTSEDVEMSLWEYLQLFRGSDPPEEKERQRMLIRLRDGEVRKGEYAVYCKLNGRIARCLVFPNENDATLLSLQFDDRWYYYKKKYSRFFRLGVNIRKMKHGELETVRRRVEAYLLSKGYRLNP